jgi:hypothetical protein
MEQCDGAIAFGVRSLIGFSRYSREVVGSDIRFCESKV